MRSPRQAGAEGVTNFLADPNFLREVAHPGGLVILDDCNHPSVATAVRNFELNAGWRSRAIGPDKRLRAF